MVLKYLTFIYISIHLFNQVFSQHSLVIKNVKCLAVDKSFCRFDECDFKTLKDGQETFNMVLRLLKIPVTNSIVGIEFKMVALNLPITFNATYDVCEFLESRRKNRILKKFYDLFASFMNTNHSCPYNHDILFKSAKQFPITLSAAWRNGEYTFKTNWIIDKKVRLKIDGTIIFVEINHTKKKFN